VRLPKLPTWIAYQLDIWGMLGSLVIGGALGILLGITLSKHRENAAWDQVRVEREFSRRIEHELKSEREANHRQAVQEHWSAVRQLLDKK
jgi:hypothetical protein